jgi:hypothetical protein
VLLGEVRLLWMMRKRRRWGLGEGSTYTPFVMKQPYENCWIGGVHYIGSYHHEPDLLAANKRSTIPSCRLPLWVSDPRLWLTPHASNHSNAKIIVILQYTVWRYHISDRICCSISFPGISREMYFQARSSARCTAQFYPWMHHVLRMP